MGVPAGALLGAQLVAAIKDKRGSRAGSPGRDFAGRPAGYRNKPGSVLGVQVGTLLGAQPGIEINWVAVLGFPVGAL
jgi:hypothetical protein